MQHVVYSSLWAGQLTSWAYHEECECSLVWDPGTPWGTLESRRSPVLFSPGATRRLGRLPVAGIPLSRSPGEDGRSGREEVSPP